MRTGRGGRGQAEREERERIRDPVGGGMNGWRWRDKRGNKQKKKRRQIAPVVCAQTDEAFPLISGSFVSFHCKFLFYFSFMDLICQLFLPVSTLTFPPAHQFTLFPTFVSLALSTL